MTKRWLMAGLVGLATLSLGPQAVGCAGPRLPNKAVGETVLTIRGQVKDGPYYLQRSDLAHLPRQGFRARPPGAQADARFDGVSLRKLLEYYLQPTEGGDTLVFVGKDGVVIPVTLGLIHQYGPIVADQIDGQPVAPRLAWPNLDQRGLDADPRSALWWNGPLEALEVVAWGRSWGRVLRPPPGSSDDARLGAGQYGLHCAGCHKFKGVGGQRGPALDGTSAKLGPGRFVTAVLRHPGWPERLGQELVSSEDVAREVAAFLAAADVSGIQPAEELKPPAPKAPPPHY